MTSFDASHLASVYGVDANDVLDFARGDFFKQIVGELRNDFAKYRNDMGSFFDKYDKYNAPEYLRKVGLNDHQ